MARLLPHLALILAACGAPDGQPASTACPPEEGPPVARAVSPSGHPRHWAPRAAGRCVELSLDATGSRDLEPRGARRALEEGGRDALLGCAFNLALGLGSPDGCSGRAFKWVAGPRRAPRHRPLDPGLLPEPCGALTVLTVLTPSVADR